jgi:hypothetical protein
VAIDAWHVELAKNRRTAPILLEGRRDYAYLAGKAYGEDTHGTRLAQVLWNSVSVAIVGFSARLRQARDYSRGLPMSGSRAAAFLNLCGRVTP